MEPDRYPLERFGIRIVFLLKSKNRAISRSLVITNHDDSSTR
jgi:hypothetical protein